MGYKVSRIMTYVALTQILIACSTTYHGLVIDADTRQPIKGAVVVAEWLEEQGTPTGGSSRLYDVKEALTDAKGEWKIRGPRGVRSESLEDVYIVLSMISFSHYTKTPTFIVFKPGYCSWPKGFQVDSCKGKIKPGGRDQVMEGEAVELPKLTSREDRLINQAIWPSLMDGNKELNKKIENFIRLKNEEKRYLGLQETDKEMENEK